MHAAQISDHLFFYKHIWLRVTVWVCAVVVLISHTIYRNVAYAHSTLIMLALFNQISFRFMAFSRRVRTHTTSTFILDWKIEGFVICAPFWVLVVFIGYVFNHQTDAEVLARDFFFLFCVLLTLAALCRGLQSLYLYHPLLGALKIDFVFYFVQFNFAPLIRRNNFNLCLMLNISLVIH